MSGVYIKGMEMPERCIDCDFLHEDRNYYGDVMSQNCFITHKELALYKKERRPDCPLVAVPDHGDLIDRQEIETKMKTRSWYIGRASDPDCLVADAPTVIPGEKEADNG